MGWGDMTKIGMQDGDYGGELDPHGATGDGNPIGGNVTSNISGKDVDYAEWMEFISYTQFCIRVCTAGNETYPPSVMCEHKLDEMGCEFIMPGDYEKHDVFQTCDADPAYPPGMFPDGGSYSSFQQRYTGTITQDGQQTAYTIGDTQTPSAAAMTPSSSNCQTTKSISNNKSSQSSSSGKDDKGSGDSDGDDDGSTNNGSTNAHGGSSAQSLVGLGLAGVIGIVSATAILI